MGTVASLRSELATQQNISEMGIQSRGASRPRIVGFDGTAQTCLGNTLLRKGLAYDSEITDVREALPQMDTISIFL